ncbi:MAG: hypothetical protein COS68_01635 [Elusimicrobia bacterium CG06_land_8_20_14_3_00_38_11]|nr:MAG: hypothetical protein COS68_01635 [Elusimicrobia bacterium CG06_land_8_20_14_3_00_38_11]
MLFEFAPLPTPLKWGYSANSFFSTSFTNLFYNKYGKMSIFLYNESVEKPCHRGTEFTEKEHIKIISVGVFSANPLIFSVALWQNDFFNSVILSNYDRKIN